MGKHAVVLLAQGFEEIEAIAAVDFLRRAGVEVTVAAVGSGADRVARGSRGVAVVADASAEDAVHARAWDAVVVPGGMPGAANIAASSACRALLAKAAEAGAVVAAICAAPAVVLAPLGLLEGRAYTCYPGMEKDVRGGRWTADRVVVDGRLVTSRGPGTALEFAAAVAAALVGEAKSAQVADAMLAGWH